MAAECVLGVDSGTQSVKVLVVSITDGRVLGRGSAPHHLLPNLPPGHMEQDPESWKAAMCEACTLAIEQSQSIAESPDSIQLRAIAISGQQHGCVVLDSDGCVVRPAKLWCDTSTAEEASEIVARVGGKDAFRAITGNALPAGFTASKLLWLKKHEPEHFAKIETILLPHDYLNRSLLATPEDRKQCAMEYGDASGTGYFNIQTRQWAYEVIDVIAPSLRRCLPSVAPPSVPRGTVDPALLARFGVRNVTSGKIGETNISSSNIPCIVAAGGGDNMMAAIGTGNVQPGVLTMSLGTSGTIFGFSDKPVLDKEGYVAGFCDSTGSWLPLVCTMNVTAVSLKVKELFKFPSFQAFDEAAQSVPPGSDGLLLLPYWAGERTPDVPNGCGVWYGQTHKNATAGHFARAAVEGIAMGMAWAKDRLHAAGLPPATQVRLTGGAASSPFWRQLLADVLDCPVVCTVEKESAAYGAAIQAAWAHRRRKGDVECRTGEDTCADIACRWVKLDETSRCFPDPRRVAVYRRIKADTDRLRQGVMPLFETIGKASSTSKL